MLSKIKIDPYIAAILGMVVVASILPARGDYEVVLSVATKLAIALLFFLYGARLPREAVLEGLTNWRLQAFVFVSTYGLFPILGVILSRVTEPFLGSTLAQGMLFLCLLPSTVQSSIAFTSIARGNVAAALCAATISNLLGVVVTPLLVAGLMAAQGKGINLSTVNDILLQILLPFALGQILRRWISTWVLKQKVMLGFVDRGSILLVVYGAFSEGVVHGIWSRVSVGSIVGLLVVNALLLAVVLVTTTLVSRRAGFNKSDEIAIVFCGSKKSMTTGIPLANVLFPVHVVSLIVLPVMLFHQIQLMACAAIARHYRAQSDALEAATAAAPPAE